MNNHYESPEKGVEPVVFLVGMSLLTLAFSILICFLVFFALK
jgi:hypothetical protein